jgi:hypothetical protein
MQNFRDFDAGPDPFGQMWHVRFKWLQTAISIRHSDSVDVKFLLESGTETMQKTISMPLPELLLVAKESGIAMTDAWCSRLAMQHVEHLIASGDDMEKDLITVSSSDLTSYDRAVREWEAGEVRRIRGAA